MFSLADASISRPDRARAFVALADLLSQQGRQAAALQALQAMQGVMEPHWGTEDQEDMVALTMQRAHLFRKLGREVRHLAVARRAAVSFIWDKEDNNNQGASSKMA